MPADLIVMYLYRVALFIILFYPFNALTDDRIYFCQGTYQNFPCSMSSSEDSKFNEQQAEKSLPPSLKELSDLLLDPASIEDLNKSSRDLLGSVIAGRIDSLQANRKIAEVELKHSILCNERRMAMDTNKCGQIARDLKILKNDLRASTG